MKKTFLIGLICSIVLISCKKEVTYTGSVEFTFKSFDLTNSSQIDPEIFFISDLDHPILNDLSVGNSGIINVSNLLMGTYVIKFTTNVGSTHYRFGKAFQVIQDETNRITIDANRDRDF